MGNTPQANSTHDLRGDYSKAGPDFVVDQEYDTYTDDDHEIWRFLLNRQLEVVTDYASSEFLDGMRRLQNDDRIPRVEEASKILRKATGWEIVAVPGFLPNDVFFNHLAHRRFPVTRWVRERHELDYLVEPDFFHDFFGHVPLLSNPVFGDYLQAYGALGAESVAHDAVHMLGRLYWYLVEFGLIQTEDGLKAYGAGILSSSGETVYSVRSEKPNRIGFDLSRVLRTDYLIDDFQKTYFVLESFDELFEATDKADFPALYRAFRDLPAIDASTIQPEDKIYHAGDNAIFPKAAE